MRTQQARLLVRPDAKVKTAAVFGAAGNQFRLQKPAEGGVWNAFETSGQITIPELWDAAYEQIEATGSTVEPDCENVWVLPASKKQRGLFAGRGGDPDRGVVNLQSLDFPQGPEFAWHLRDDYSQLRQARNSIGDTPAPVRGAVLDVGFDFNHAAMPAHLRRDLERNFSGEGDATAIDPDLGGLLRNPGHGTATICLLAGRQLAGMKAPTPSGDLLGGAPAMEVIPIRIANAVVLLRTSAFAEAIQYLIRLQTEQKLEIDVVSMSMGGVASGAWADAVNAAYDAGITIVTAAGNNYGRPKSIVFPARFSRVLAACGVMADFTPYELALGTMSGNFGPDSKMDTAIAAFTPNIPWAEIGSGNIVDWDGQGTSSATPQVAAAVALWLQKHKPAMAGWESWQRVEMVRKALFQSADKSKSESRKYFGQGIVKAFNALSVRPTQQARASLAKQTQDSAAFAFFRVLRGTLFGAAARRDQPFDSAFNLELTQLMHRDPALEEILPDPAKGLGDPAQMRKFFEAAIDSPYSSTRLRKELDRSFRKPGAGGGARGDGNVSKAPKPGKDEFHPNTPSERRLQVFSFDPAAERALASAQIARATIGVPWERLEPGPSGEYVEVVDHDPASGCFYAPVDLEDGRLLASDGLAPAEGNPKFHQQMVYAVSMRTINTFERALGRRALWSPVTDGQQETAYVQKLRIYPHALRARNAYYNPIKKALLFGYFPAQPQSLATINPGGMVFTCLSHDVVAHEISHALLDGMARGLVYPTNSDMLAFHEAFADIVAMFQHFSLPDVLDYELARTKGNLRGNSFLVELAQEFGQGAGLNGALRSYLGTAPNPDLLAKTMDSHDRGAILVAAVFDAFVSIYEGRIADLRRIASNGTGILPAGELHPDLVNRFATEASKAASHVLRMCIRAIDYCPPVDMNFGDFLRALITADSDLYPEDPCNYRVSLIEAFRKRGIYPRDIRTMSQDSLRWRRPETAALAAFYATTAGAKLLFRLRSLGDLVRRVARENDEVDWPIAERKILDAWKPEPRPGRPKPKGGGIRPGRRIPAREAVFHLLRQERIQAHDLLMDALNEMKPEHSQMLLREFGVFDPGLKSPRLQVHALNFADREEESGTVRRDVIFWLTHERDGRQGGCTLIANCDTGEIRFLVRKNFTSETRHRETLKFAQMGMGSTYFGMTPLAGPGSRFAMIHESTGAQEEGYA